ncbi:MAG: MoaD/ThiS family protein [Cytophagales bacterium]|nr:MoaD/ThiS family protein [Rhizobacter sp.]
MKIQVRYFASLREALGSAETVDAADGSTVGQLRDALIARGAPHADALARGRAVRTALDQVLCSEATPLREGAELAFFPPVTGG